MDLFTTIRFIFNWLFILLKFLMILILFPFFWIFNQISRLLGRPAMGSVAPSLPPQLQQPEAGITMDLPGWEIVKSLLFWLVFLAIIIFAIRQYIQTNRRLVEMLHQLRISRWILEAWSWITKQFQSAERGIGAMIEAGVNRLRLLRSSAKQTERWHYINPNRMIPRQRILFFYLSLLRRAAEAGTPRSSWETPVEFSRKLRLVIPEENEMVASLTKAFMDARYGLQEMTREDAEKTRTIWVRLTGILRKKTPGGKSILRIVTGITLLNLAKYVHLFYTFQLMRSQVIEFRFELDIHKYKRCHNGFSPRSSFSADGGPARSHPPVGGRGSIGLQTPGLAGCYGYRKNIYHRLCYPATPETCTYYGS